VRKKARTFDDQGHFLTFQRLRKIRVISIFPKAPVAKVAVIAQPSDVKRLRRDSERMHFCRIMSLVSHIEKLKRQVV
jgi:hypothetical protein